MSRLANHIEHALNETRILILGAQVLVGFEFRSLLEPGFDKLPALAQYVKLGALGLLVLALGLLIAPGAYHQVVWGGRDEPAVPEFTWRMATIALLPLGLAFGADFGVVFEKVLGSPVGLIGGVLTVGTAFFFWYALEWIAHARRSSIREGLANGEMMEEANPMDGGDLENRIKQVLTEARMVLPGAQALLGFQLASVLMEGFDKLPENSRLIHLASLSLVALATILLMTPAAYHRIVEEGADTEQLHHFASRVVVFSLVPLALGIVGDLYVVAEKVTRSPSVALVLAGISLAFYFGLWFGLTGVLRARRPPLDRQGGADKESA